MTEAEWLTATDLTPMLEFLRGKVSDRKVRLFAVACCYHIWDQLTDERSRLAVSIAERCADELASRQDLLSANISASIVEEAHFDAAYPDKLEHHDDWSWEVCCDASAAASTAERATSDYPIGMSEEDHQGKRLPGKSHPGIYSVYGYAQRARAHLTSPLQYELIRWQDTPDRSSAKCAEALAQTLIALDIFGNPYRPESLNPSWLSSTVLALATGIYEERAFDRMPILADALQDAGCDNEDILNHLRGDGPHVLGCWALDLVLGKS